ncbi:hypothetical protein Rhal01_01235 [Rubritalea halochordaticola]|uniref:Uncharacterized protein n=1 Tax=Rubritalea halochordaticola TaxID=714537 RepID=A0ABP9UZ97_9BACT
MPRTKREDETLVARILRAKPPLFWWFLANTLALCLAILSWVLFLNVFQTPDNPRNYKILEWLGRLEPIEAFTALNAPKGDALSPPTLYKKYYNLTENDRKLLNKLLLKNYISNLDDTTLNTYIQGQYRILQTRPLTELDVISNGIAIQAQALVKPDDFHPETPYLVLIEFILPGTSNSATDPYTISKGDLLQINKNPFHGSVLHVERIDRPGDEPLISLTVVPLVYETPFTTPSGAKFKMTPPEHINLEARFPIFKAN